MQAINSVSNKQVIKITSVTRILEKIWKDIKTYNSEAIWIKGRENMSKNQEKQKWMDVTKEEAVLAIMKHSKWKAQGNDGIANFWLKNLPSIHEKLATAQKEFLTQPEKAPDWLTEGLTHLLPKTEETKNPKN